MIPTKSDSSKNIYGVITMVVVIGISAIGYIASKQSFHGDKVGHQPMVERVKGIKDDVNEIKLDQREMSNEIKDIGKNIQELLHKP